MQVYKLAYPCMLEDVEVNTIKHTETHTNIQKHTHMHACTGTHASMHKESTSLSLVSGATDLRAREGHKFPG